MLLQLCGELAAAGPGIWSGRFDPAAYPLRRLEGDREQGYPAFLVAEALNQAGCRAANAEAGGSKRFLPAVMRDFTVDAEAAGKIADSGGMLEARIVRREPAVEVDCMLRSADGAELARATVVVAAMTRVAA